MKKEIRIGLTLLSALAVFYLALTWLSRTQLFAPEERHYFIKFDNVNGLLEGDPVLIRGFTSGRVINIVPKPETVLVEIALDRKIQLYADARAEIQIKELMGGKQIAVSVGESGPEIIDGGEIEGAIALDFSSGFSKFGELSEGIDPVRIGGILNKVDSLMDAFQALVGQMSPQRIDQAFSQTERALGQLNNTLFKVNSQIDFQKIDSLAFAAELGIQKGTAFIEQASNLMDRFQDSTLRQVETGIKDFPELMAELKMGLENLNEISGALQNSNSVASRILSDESLSRSLDTTLYNLNKTLEQIHSKRVIVGLKRKKKDR